MRGLYRYFKWNQDNVMEHCVKMKHLSCKKSSVLVHNSYADIILSLHVRICLLTIGKKDQALAVYSLTKQTPAQWSVRVIT